MQQVAQQPETYTSVIMIRHAQSEWNKQNLFSGWADPELTELGIEEAEKAANILKNKGFHFDCAFTSILKRAEETAKIVLEGLGQSDLLPIRDWRLNERHYGSLQGKSKSGMAEKVGEDQVWRWRRGYADTPPPMDLNDPEHPRFSSLFSHIDPALLPSTESLADTQVRTMECWNDIILKAIKQKQCVLLAAHGNTLRALIMALSDMTVEEVEDFEIPTGVPIEYLFDQKGKGISWRYLEEA